MRVEFDSKKDHAKTVRVLQESGLVQLVPHGKTKGREIYSVYQAGKYDPSDPIQGIVGRVGSTSAELDERFGLGFDPGYVQRVLQATSEINWQ